MQHVVSDGRKARNCKHFAVRNARSPTDNDFLLPDVKEAFSHISRMSFVFDRSKCHRANYFALPYRSTVDTGSRDLVRTEFTSNWLHSVGVARVSSQMTSYLDPSAEFFYSISAG